MGSIGSHVHLTPAISGAAQQARAIAVCWESVRLIVCLDG